MEAKLDLLDIYKKITKIRVLENKLSDLFKKVKFQEQHISVLDKSLFLL